MENSGDSARDSARDSGELRGGLRNSGDSDHSFWRTQGGTQGAQVSPRGAGKKLPSVCDQPTASTSGVRPEGRRDSICWHVKLMTCLMSYKLIYVLYLNYTCGHTSYTLLSHAWSCDVDF